ncbi:polysaccharide biosynthesis tyrosine autokinase [Ornithinimicrobium cryptoxanthini]|uniref:polysaccharide biosynthesis tyrosine autokinase n=1 Tax=Ornithinimicrobium cryptoxanthini TaxID=2934161 RepID=UPI002741DF0A|nr:polysaccharide biosynthesis tyrosine autokinase [Ornithinimicrobium cryptoxanthini]
MTLGDFLQILRQHWGYVAGAIVGLLVLAGTLTWFTEPSYESTAQVYISTSGSQGVSDLVQGSSFTQRQVTTYADLVTIPEVLEPVALTLGIDNVQSLERSLRAQEIPNTVLINIIAADRDPGLAADKANAVSEEFAAMIERLEGDGEAGPSPVQANVVRPATASASPASPDVTRNLLVALLLGLVLGPVLAVLREVLDTSVSDEDDVTALTDATILGRIGVDREVSTEQLLFATDPHSPRAEAFRKLRTNLQFIEAAQSHRSFLVTSSLPGEGKTTTTLSLARVLAEGGSSVCVVDADLRRPRLMEAVGLEGAIGLTNLLIGDLTLREVTQTWMGRVTMIGSGPIPPNPSELLGSPRMRELLETLQGEYDYVLIDTPPLLPVTDAAVLTALAGGTILVVGVTIIKTEHLHSSLEILRNVEAPLLGLVLNRLPTSSSSPYAYGYGYGYHQERATEPSRFRRAALGGRPPRMPVGPGPHAAAPTGDPAIDRPEGAAEEQQAHAPGGGRGRSGQEARSLGQGEQLT